jgi:hypothetical protein
MNLNLTQRKLNKSEVEFLLWFLSLSNDNPYNHPVEYTMFHGHENKVNNFKNLVIKLKTIQKSYLS